VTQCDNLVKEMLCHDEKWEKRGVLTVEIRLYTGGSRGLILELPGHRALTKSSRRPKNGRKRFTELDESAKMERTGAGGAYLFAKTGLELVR
jgi:hypothetical protein